MRVSKIIQIRQTNLEFVKHKLSIQNQQTKSTTKIPNHKRSDEW